MQNGESASCMLASSIVTELAQVWADFAVECRRVLGIDFQPVDLRPLDAYANIPPAVRALWSEGYPTSPVPLDCLLFPRPSEFSEIIESQFGEDWPRAYLPLSHVRDGHFSYQLVSERVFLVTNEEHWEPPEAMANADYPSLVAFVRAATNTLRLSGTSFFEVRKQRNRFRSVDTTWIDSGTCSALAQTWQHDGYCPLLFGSSVDGIRLEDLAVPKEFRKLMHGRDY